jgi:hypothetical protein
MRPPPPLHPPSSARPCSVHPCQPVSACITPLSPSHWLLPSQWAPVVALAHILVKRVRARAPPGEEHGQADGLEDARDGADGDLVERALLEYDLADELVLLALTCLLSDI